MKPKSFKFILISIFLINCTFLIGLKDISAKKYTPYYWVNKITFEANILFDDQTLTKVLGLGKGIKMTPRTMELLIDEVEGFYFSHGYFLVKVDIPKKRPQKGMLKLRIFETEDIMLGNGEEARAKREVENLVKMAGLQIDEKMKVDVAKKLVQGYKAIRFKKLEARSQRLDKISRQEEKSKKVAEEVSKRKKLNN